MAHAVQRNTARTDGDIPEVQDTRFAVADSTQQSHADGGWLCVAGGAVVEVVDVTVTQESLCLAPRIDEQHCQPRPPPQRACGSGCDPHIQQLESCEGAMRENIGGAGHV
eukprot:COSAG01_NODE_429_length_17183_cov_22.990869_11_plen_110_part_00